MKGWTFWGFSTSILSQNIKKLKGGPFGEKICIRKEVSQSRKSERGDPLVSPGMVCYAGKQEKLFWFNSLGQIAQFGAVIFCRTFVELFWSVQVVLKKTLTKRNDYSRHFSKEKRRLKNFLVSKVGSAHRVCKTVSVAQVFGSLEKTGTVELKFEKLLFKKSYLVLNQISLINKNTRFSHLCESVKHKSSTFRNNL